MAQWLLLALLPWAAAAADLPSSASAGQIERRFERTPEARSSSRPFGIPSTSVNAAPAGSEDIRFTLSRVDYDGATAFASADLAALHADLLGKEIALTKVYALADAVTRLYTGAGYLLSRAVVPDQVIENGQVRLQVVEGYVDSVNFDGLEGIRPGIFEHHIGKYPEPKVYELGIRPGLFENYIARIKASRPLHRAVLERYLLLINDIPGMHFKAVLGPSDKGIGATILTLIATRERWSGALSFDNRGAKTSGPWQGMIELTGNNLLNLLDSTTLRYATVPDDPQELHYWAVSHQQLLSHEGLRLNLEFNGAYSEPGSELFEQLEAKTSTLSSGFNLSYPFIRSRTRNLTINAGAALKDSKVKLLGSTASDDDLSVLALGASFDQADALAGGGVTLLSATLSQGLDVLGADVTSRAEADPDFTVVSLYAWRSQSVTDRLRAELRLEGQLTGQSLPSVEQAGLGGEFSVRGFEPSEWTGDRLFNASFELVYNPDVPLIPTAELYGFYDYGKIWREDAQIGEDSSDSADSAGLGTRLELTPGLGMNLEVARALSDDSEGDSPGWELYVRFREEF